MTTGSDRKLVEKYPELLANSAKPPTESLMCFGCECGDGWHKILDHLFGYFTSLMNRTLLVNYTKEYQDLHRGKKDYYQNYQSYRFSPPKIVLDQVKEKWGLIRIYHHTEFDGVPDDVWNVLNLEEFYKKMKEYEDILDWAIAFAEYQSSVTCEITGKDGKLYTHGWYRVLCDEEAVRLGYSPEQGGKLEIENM